MGTDILMFLQKISNPVLDEFFIFVTDLGSEIFYVITISFVFWLINKKLGIKLFLITVGSIYLNTVLKDTFHTQRPIFHKDINSLYKESAPGYSFPSGHTQGSTTFWTYLMGKIKNKYFNVLGWSMIFLVGFSRLYLRVHWPIDVIGGFFIGIIIALLGDYIIEKVSRLNINLISMLIFTSVLPNILLLFYINENNVKLFALLTGSIIGFIIEIKHIDFRERGPIHKQVIKYIVGIGTFLVIRSQLKLILPYGLIFDYIRYLLCGLWITLFAPMFFVIIGLSEKKI